MEKKGPESNFLNENPPPYSSQPADGAPMQAHSSGVVYIPNAPVVITVAPMGTSPARFTCRSCRADIITRIDSRIGTRAHLFAFIFCITGLWPCICLPYLIQSCHNVDHYCPNCNAYIGSARNDL